MHISKVLMVLWVLVKVSRTQTHRAVQHFPILQIWDVLLTTDTKLSLECHANCTFSGSMSTRSTSICKDPNVVKHLSLLHDKYVIVSADKAPNNIVFVCKSHYIDDQIKELGIDNLPGNPTYTPTTLTKEEILDNHRSVLCSFGISTKDEELDLLDS